MGDDPPDRSLLEDDPQIDTLQQRIARASQKEAARTKGRGSEVDANYRQGNRVLADLIGGIGGGALIGWLLDSWLDTAPWLLLAMMALGIIVAFRNIMRATGTPPGD